MIAKPPTSHNTAETQLVEVAGIEFAYRRFGRPAEMPLVMLQHFHSTEVATDVGEFLTADEGNVASSVRT